MTHPRPSRFHEAPRTEDSKTLRASGVWTGHRQTRVQVRDFSLIADQPAALGGRDAGPTPMELLSGAVGACAVVVVEQEADRIGVEMTGLSVYSLARQDRRGMAGTADVQPYMHTYRLQLCVGTPVRDEAVLRKLAATVEHRCPAINLLRDAATGLTVDWVFAPAIDDDDAEAVVNAALGYRPAAGLPPHLADPVLHVADADAPTSSSAALAGADR